MLDHFGQARLVDRNFALVEEVDLLLDDVDASDLVAAVGETGAGDKADVTGADDCDLHGSLAEVSEPTS